MERTHQMKYSISFLTALLLAAIATLLAADRLLAATAPILTEVADGLVFGDGTDPRVHFIGSRQAGYDVVFERQAADGWQQVATFPTGQYEE